jgi:hypothetical protein
METIIDINCPADKVKTCPFCDENKYSIRNLAFSCGAGVFCLIDPNGSILYDAKKIEIRSPCKNSQTLHAKYNPIEQKLAKPNVDAI